MKDGWYTQRDLFEMGWTYHTIAAFLPEPKLEYRAYNPDHPYKLWQKETVDDAMRTHGLTEKFAARVSKRAERNARIKRNRLYADLIDEKKRLIERLAEIDEELNKLNDMV